MKQTPTDSRAQEEQVCAGSEATLESGMLLNESPVPWHSFASPKTGGG